MVTSGKHMVNEWNHMVNEMEKRKISHLPWHWLINVA